MVSKFRKFIDKKGLFKEDDKILLACSGGVDSMVLADLLLINENNFGIAHINHQTRATESDDDQDFVEQYCKENNIPFHSISASIEHLAQEAKKNFQDYARSFRYEFLNDIRDNHGYDYIATAHHSSDTLETFFINLTRGTGLDGLTGIPLRTKKVIRPLMFASKEEIIYYSDKFKIPYREDSSNESTKYTRNFLRHEVIPQVAKLSDDAIANSKATILRLEKTKTLLRELISSQEFVRKQEGESYIEKSKILLLKEKETLLYYVLKNYGFNFDQCHQIITSINNTGIVFYSHKYQLLVDRKNLILKLKNDEDFAELNIEAAGTYKLSQNKMISIRQVNQPSFSDNKNVEYVNAEKLKFPLIVRKWTNGDKFRPLGMNGMQKKVKDYLTNSKLSRFEKNIQLVLVSNNEIIWLIGHRLSEIVKYDDQSQNCFRIEIH